MEFLYQKENFFVYTSVENSAEYIRSVRKKSQSLKRVSKKMGRNFSRNLSSGKNQTLNRYRCLVKKVTAPNKE